MAMMDSIRDRAATASTSDRKDSQPYRTWVTPVLTIVCLSITFLSVNGCASHPEAGRSIALPHAAPFTPGLVVRPAVHRECDLERRVPAEIAGEIRRQFANVDRVTTIDPAMPGLTLDLRIVNVEGKKGMAPGHKSLTVQGVLRDNGVRVGNFTAKRRTKRGRRTCPMLHNNIREIAADVSEWLRTPTRDAFLGDARPGDYPLFLDTESDNK